MVQRVCGIHTGGDYPRAEIERLLRNSHVVKCCLEWNDRGIYMDWHNRYPNHVFIGRPIAYDLEGHELQVRYNNATIDNVQDVAYWYADLIAANSQGLEFFFWESGINELNDYSGKWPKYCKAFGERMRQHGLKVALGGWSYGRPSIPPLDPDDTWLQWYDVFRFIDDYNRVNGVALTNPNALLYMHEGAILKSMESSVPYTVGRFNLIYERHIKPNNWWVPVVLTEFAYGYDNPNYGKPATTEEMVRQILWVNNYLAQFTYLVGYAWYDYRAASNGTPDDYMYCVGDIMSALEAQNYTERILVPPGGTAPPPPPPPPNEVWTVKIVSWVNQRSGPGSSYDKVGSIQVANPPTVLKVYSNKVNDYHEVVGQGTWIFSNNGGNVVRIG